MRVLKPTIPPESRRLTVLQRWVRGAMLLAAGFLLTGPPVVGAVTPEQRKELTALRSEVNKVNSLIRSKQLDDADQALKAADVRIAGLTEEVLGGLVRSFRQGGVGFYYRSGPKGGWIHTDTGLNRTWKG